MNTLWSVIVLTSFASSTLATPLNQSPTQSLSSQSLREFQSNPSSVKRAIEMGLDLTKQNIGYRYGSADPKSGGMDCSGTIHFLLKKLGVESAPRSSEAIFQWVKKEGKLHLIESKDPTRMDLSNLKPGDLLFWSGTYKAPGNSFITHVMMYLGEDAQGNRLMMGSSDGRTYKGKQIFGVSVFDFILPKMTSQSKFIGYSCIPHVSCG